MWTPPELPPYVPPTGFRAGHLQTVIPSLFRTVEGVAYRRTRLELDDGDFLDLDRLAARLSAGTSGRPSRVVLIAHGLEGSSERAYVRGMENRGRYVVEAW